MISHRELNNFNEEEEEKLSSSVKNNESFNEGSSIDYN
jgi:hypothetical protein